ncbi:hypothetical protein WV31_10190 [Magnetospirillum sp. ME-1]|uniref:hypothetical protein n=1 Tax=Magnetospirillum sp. ME-1 TaxID=1639348 RepID=UPI000A17DB80|nr:hypothetical protein [Magnetospirillum sp. ME-1]ARJ65996.1 hypothetical protein WV31_10190 [Magnetospirillum sp. ME-1]
MHIERTETFIAIAQGGENLDLGWARGDLDAEGSIPLVSLRSMALLAALKGDIYARDPEAIQPHLDEILGTRRTPAPRVLPFDEHPHIVLGRRHLDRALLIEIGLRADRYASEAVWPHTSARRLAVEAALNAAFLGPMMAKGVPSHRAFAPDRKIVSLQAIRLRRTIDILVQRTRENQSDPRLSWLASGLSKATTGLRRELKAAEKAERAM